jgi:apolipoprotein N-acyltransferase
MATSVTSGLLLALPFLSPVLFPLAWICFIPLFWAIEHARHVGKAIFSGWLTGVTANLIGFYWLVYTIRVFGGFSYGVSSLIFFLFTGLVGIQIAIIALLDRCIVLGTLNLFPAIFWVALEFWFPLLFPWHLANTQTHFLTMIQSDDLVGPYGTSFLIMWFNATIYTILFLPERRAKSSLGPAALVGLFIISTLIYGHLRLRAVTSEMSVAPKLTVTAVQGNIDVQFKWDPKRLKQNLDAYLDLTKKAQGTTLVIWPETAVEEWLPEEIQKLPPELIPQLNSSKSHFIFGVRSFRGTLTGPSSRAFNIVFLTDAQGRVLSHYHKQVLLAFGEYVPFSGVLSKLPGMPPLDGFTEGDGPHTLDLSEGIKNGPLICYEDLMPELSRRFVAETKANLLLNLTNDAWYGKTVAPWQHAWLAQWRAIETRRTLVRATNTGLTTVINAKGEMLDTLPTFSLGLLTTEAEILDGKTFYVLFGDWFAGVG